MKLASGFPASEGKRYYRNLIHQVKGPGTTYVAILAAFATFAYAWEQVHPILPCRIAVEV